ncbi:uncharacterized protein CPUR_05330 [Claviceps purpurea 20.1]|uniref:Uncharacterized protein n=1 Tax=Claviceps purpurea (strain 20.1) TaxID=1111077 RepID=M1VWL4_CLAP2|nr:uncharacterized protein CPUR_05330 [Claviceps purpurea 20.1]
MRFPGGSSRHDHGSQSRASFMGEKSFKTRQV